MHAAGCCEPVEPAAKGLAVTELDAFDESDPTLASCCQRELEENRRAARIVDKLRAADRIDARTRLADQISNFQHDLETDSDDEDNQLSRLRDLRLQEIHMARQQNGQSAQLRESKEEDVMEQIRSQDGSCLLFLTLPGNPVCQEAIEFLETQAYRYKDVQFIQTSLSRNSKLPPMLGLPHSAAFLYFKDGSLVDTGLLAYFCSGDDFLEEKALEWMQRKGVIRKDEGSTSEEEDEKAADDWREPCEICGRRYFHEHIRPKTAYSDGRKGNLYDDSDQEE